MNNFHVGNACFPYKEYICLSHAGGLRWQNLFLVIVESAIAEYPPWHILTTEAYKTERAGFFFIIIDTKWKKIDTCHFKGLKGSDRKVSLWGIKNKHGGNPIAESICTYTGSLRVVPHFSSGIVERAKRERAWKSPHARKGVLGLIVAGYVPLAPQNPYPIIVYSVANYIWL